MTLDSSTASASTDAADPFEPAGVVRRALAGDREAERDVCRRLLPAVRAFARRRLRPPAAEDFAQEALLLLVESIRENRIVEPDQISSFALGICRNLAREGARVSERRALLLEKYGATEADLVSVDVPLEVRRGNLEDCYSQLTERARTVVRRTFCNDDTDGEIAAELDISTQNVRVIRHRSLATLRSCLERPISWVRQ